MAWGASLGRVGRARRAGVAFVFCAAVARAAFPAPALSTAAPEAPLPPLTDVFDPAVDTAYACYRIPALVRDPRDAGSLLAFAEGRFFDCADHGHVDVVTKASADGGRTWGPVRRVYGESSPAANVTIGNPAPVALSGGRLLLPLCRNNLAVLLLTSPDFGATWSAPTLVPTPPAWTWVATGPPGSVQLTAGPAAGRVLVPINHGEGGAYTAGALVSDDLGATFRVGAGGVAGGNECQIAELAWESTAASSAALLSMRNARGAARLLARSDSGGEAWGAPWAGVAEGECEASTVALPRARVVLLSSAFDAARVNMTLHASRDAGATWAPLARVYAGKSAYSALSPAPDEGSVALLFERDGYARISLATLPLAF